MTTTPRRPASTIGWSLPRHRRGDRPTSAEPLEAMTRDAVAISLSTGMSLIETLRLRVDDVTGAADKTAVRVCRNSALVILVISVASHVAPVLRRRAAAANAAGRERLFETSAGVPLDPADVFATLVDLVDEEGEICAGFTVTAAR